ncbi:hypothetical protein GX48_04442 [Paracoccidioides brasiliensis]|nr:hypothetical protein GX48_04442 [Paracoccidioides brasiliensis]
MLPKSSSPFMDLPTELHAQITSYLSYPDALALKHTNTYFYALVQTGLVLKVNWILERCRLKLRVPFSTCEFRTDQTFCNREIREIMQTRRRHQECKPDIISTSLLALALLFPGGQNKFIRWIILLRNTVLGSAPPFGMLDTTTVSMSARNFAKIPSNPSEQDRGIRLLDRRRNLMLAWNINTYNVGASHLSLRQFNVLRHCDIFDEYDASSPKKPSELWVSLRAGKYPLDDYRQHVNKVFSLGLKDNLNYAAGE